MRVIVLGGAGDMGSQAVEDLAATPEVEEVTIADRDVVAAKTLADRLTRGPARVSVRAVDARDHADLVSAIKRHDVVASALGPFYVFETKAARAAIEAGVDYISICDDWIAARNVIDVLDQVAREAGRIVITGMGASPGLTNVAARYLADQLDTVRTVDIAVFMPLESGEGLAVIKHVLFIFGGLVPVFRGGQTRMVRSTSIVKDVEFPKYGRVRTWNVGHAEPVTIPRFIPGVNEVVLRMGMGRGTGLFVAAGRARLFDTQARIDRLAPLLKRFAPKPKPHAPAAEGAIRVDVIGERGGKEEHLMACGLGVMRPGTGIPLSIGAQFLARRQLRVSDCGVYAPEAAFDPLAVLGPLIEKTGMQAFTDLAMTQPILG